MKKKLEKRLRKPDEARLCQLWRERKLNLEIAVEEERELQARLETGKARLAADKKEQERAVETLHALEQSLIKQTYQDLQEQLHSVENGTLLLPSIPNTVPDDHGSGMSLVSARAHALSLEKEKNHLIAEACHYRDLAEGLKTTNRHLRNEMHDKIEAVRNFWRNNIKEQTTRGGRMVMASLRN